MGPERGGSPTGGELLGMGVFLAAAVVVPLIAGIGLDAVAGTGPWFLFVGLVVGIALAVAAVYTRMRKYL
jgi:F0F1-type ATP synthase assembly protein I